MTQNADRIVAADPPPASDIAARTAARTLAARTAGYTHEVRRLLDAGLVVIARNGMRSRPRVADIVAEAGLSNDAFYRHFPSKDALVTALLEDGTERLASYVTHQMSKESAPEDKIRRWVESVLSQARADIAETTLAILWNGSSVGGSVVAGRHPASSTLSVMLHEPFAALGDPDPQTDAALVAHAVFGMLTDFLARRAEPTPTEIERITAFCLRAATRSPGGNWS